MHILYTVRVYKSQNMFENIRNYEDKSNLPKCIK